MTEAFDTLAIEIGDRLTAIEGSIAEQTGEEKVRSIIAGMMPDLMADPEFVRKMRFGGSDPKLVGTKFARWGLNVADIEFLHDFMETQRSIGGPGPSDELRNTFAAISEAYYLPMDQVRAIDKNAIDDLFPRLPLSEFHGEDRSFASKGDFQLTGAYQRAIRAMDTAESGYGSQLIGAQYVGELWEAVRRESRVMGLIDSFEMTAPTAYLPVEADLPEMLFVAENTSGTASDYGTTKTGSNRAEVSAKKFLVHQVWSGEMDEDSILPFVPYIRRQAVASITHYVDSVLVNGDTTNTATGNINLDDADPADTKHYLALDGIRHIGLVDATGQQKDMSAGAITLDALKKASGRMVDSTYLMDWGHPSDPMDLVYLADPETADAIGLLDDVLIWRQMQGDALLTGEVARPLGHPVIGSMAVSKTEADGFVSTTAGNNTLGQVVPFNRRGFKIGWRRRVKVEVERLPGRDQTRLVHSLRLGFGRYTPTGAASGLKCADVIFNVGL